MDVRNSSPIISDSEKLLTLLIYNFKKGDIYQTTDEVTMT